MPPVTPYTKYLGDRDPIAALRETSGRIAALASGWSPADFERTYEPGKWSARLILAHLAHIEIAFGMRVRMALTTPGYIHWAKTQSKVRYNLATSGVGPFPFRELPFHCEQFALEADDGYGYVPLVCAIAAKAGVAPDCVVTAAGTSMANYLAMATLL